MIKPIQPCTIKHENNNYSYRMTREHGYADCNINIENINDNRPIGGSSFLVNKKTKRIEKVAMAMSSNADKNKGLGTTLHLGHIQTLVRNGLKEISLMSFKESILFHAKFGFRADIQNIRHMVTALNKVAQNKDERLRGPRNMARYLLKDAPVKPVVDEAENRMNYWNSMYMMFKNPEESGNALRSKGLTRSEKQFLEKGNKVLNSFLRKLLNLNLPREEVYKSADFMVPFHMKLSKSLVFKNKDFYNALYKKFSMNFRLK